MDVLEKVGLIALGSLLSLVTYVIKRRVENKPNEEMLNRHKVILDIHKQMNEQGLGVEDLRNLEEILTGKSNSLKQHSSQLSVESEEAPLIPEETEFLSQSELNIRASEKLEKAKRKLLRVIGDIDARVGDAESQALMSSQRAWEIYSTEQAEAAAAGYKEGSIYSLIYLSELESLTLERTARLQSELDELIRLGN